LEASQQALTLPPRASHLDAEHPQFLESAIEETTLLHALEGLRGERNESRAAKDFKVPLEALLNENGRVFIPEGFSGSIDPEGFDLVSQNGEAPRFIRSERSNAQWSADEFGVPGCDNAVLAMAVVSGELFLGGSFQTCGLSVNSNIARFDPMSGEFLALGDGVSGTVRALTAIGTDLYVGGSFNQAGSVTASHIARFDTTQSGNAGWSALGGGVNDIVWSLAVVGTDLYVGGEFTEAGGSASILIAKFDTIQGGNTGWSALGDGVNSTFSPTASVRAMAVIGTDLYVGGQFNLAGGASANQIARFDTTQNGNDGWAALGNGANNSVLALTAIGTDLYVGGGFSIAGGVPMNRIAKFDTTQSGNAGWSALGDGVNSAVWALTAMSNTLYVGGDISIAGGLSVSKIARFDTTQSSNAGWTPLGNGVNGRVSTLTASSTELFVGGTFSQAGEKAGSNLAKNDLSQSGNASWFALGDGLNNQVLALAAIGTDLYVGGGFRRVGGIAADFIARFDTTQTGNAGWSALGDGVNSTVHTLAAIGTTLYVGGTFTQAAGSPASRVAAFDTTQSGNAGWSALGDGVNFQLAAMATIGTDLYVGGVFTQAGGAAANRVAKFDTTQSGNAGWSALGDGVNSNVTALAAIGTNLYVGGFFSQAGGSAANRVARFDSIQGGNAGWSALGDGVDGSVVAMTAIDAELYVAGGFTQAGGSAANRIAVFNTNQSGNAGWSALGDGVDASVVDLTAIDTDLYVAGGFTQAGGVAANFIAKLDTIGIGNTGWSALGDGLSGNGQALIAVGTDLYVGGRFRQAGSKVNGFFARFETIPNQLPNAQHDAFNAREDQPLDDNVFLDNGNGPDFDPDGDNFELQSPGTFTAGGIGGSVTTQANGDFYYTPLLNASGVATFDYTIADPSGATDSATVTITVQAVNDAPSFTATDPAAVQEDAGPQSIINWASFDAGAPNETDTVLGYTVSAVSDPSLFAAGPSVDIAGTLSFTPADDAFGTSTFEVTVQDDGGTDNGGVDTSDPQTFTITVDAVDDPPLAVDDLATLDEDAPATAIAVLSNDTDVDAGPIAIDSVTQPASGTVVITGGGTGLTYQPDAEQCNDGNPSDDFTYTLIPGGSTATVSVTVNCINDAPVADDASASTNEDTPVTIVLSGSDIEASPLGFSIAAAPTNGSLGAITPIDATSAEVSYTPNADFNGSDSFTFVANDGTASSPDATVTLTIEPVNDAPSFTNAGNVSVIEDASYSDEWASAILPGPANESGQTVSFLVTGNSNPALFQSGPAIDASGNLTFVPAADTTGTADIEVIAEDDGGTPNGGNNQSDPVTLTIDVLAATDLAITKTADAEFYEPGQLITYTLVISNPGPSDVSGALVSDPLPAGLETASWTCMGQGGGSCAAAGTTLLDEPIDLPEGAVVTFTLTATVQAGLTDAITNTGTVTEPAGIVELNGLDNSASNTVLAIDLFQDRFEPIDGNR
jgi:uncharacterized repeat protein (TIGR01451 family)